ncbi:MAG TPA: putative 4-mercaptohistidine N1-methyltransferase [Candidatus Methylacidiphilales bacterium]|nr:putative 4-mercaptohistidine N1-methyltransferase [Candidatus Methylacidiphilales bacterium]
MAPATELEPVSVSASASPSAPVPYYESDKGLSEYLLFHYGTAEQTLPRQLSAILPGSHVLEYPVRCVRDMLHGIDDLGTIPGEHTRALDLGCAVGRSTFEFTAFCEEAIGIDYSHSFVAAAQQMQRDGRMSGHILVEGNVSEPAVFEFAPGREAGIDRTRAAFQQGDAMELPLAELGSFHLVLMANLIDRLREPRRCLAQMPALVRPGGLLIITSPYTWLEEYTPRENWLQSPTTLKALEAALEESFTLIKTADLPFLIREHSRKYQYSVAQGSVWRRNS